MVELYGYQARTVADVMSTTDNVCVVSPTGSGKTTMGAEIAVRTGGRVIWVAHRQELVNDAFDRLVEMGHGNATCSTVQSLDECECDLLVLDECHHYAADEWGQITRKVKYKRRIGLTATPTRGDGKALKGLFDRLVIAAQYSELLQSGHISRCRVFAGPDQDGLALNPLKAWLEHGKKRLTMAFAPSVEQAAKWSDEFNWGGVRSAYVTGEHSPALRASILEDFAACKITVLWNVYVLTEGVNIPATSCILLARSCDTASTYLQIVGRGLRTAPGKRDCVLIDLVGAFRRHGMPTEDRAYSIDGRKPISRAKVQRLRQCVSCGAVCIAWVGKCPECGYVTDKSRLPVKVHSEKLLEVFDGENTKQDAKDEELERLVALCREKGYRIGWVAVQYAQLFGKQCIIRSATPEEKREQLAVLETQARSKNYAPGWVGYRYKALFGEWPQRRRA